MLLLFRSAQCGIPGVLFVRHAAPETQECRPRGSGRGLPSYTYGRPKPIETDQEESVQRSDQRPPRIPARRGFRQYRDRLGPRRKPAGETDPVRKKILRRVDVLSAP